MFYTIISIWKGIILENCLLLVFSSLFQLNVAAPISNPKGFFFVILKMEKIQVFVPLYMFGLFFYFSMGLLF